MSSSKGVSKTVASPAPAQSKSVARKEPAPAPQAAPKKAKTSGDGVRVSGNDKERSNAATPNFGTWGASSPGLRRGQSGDDVKSLQHQLNAQGAGLKTDGEFGSKTEKALRNFQRRKGIEQDGVAGSDTAKQLEKGLTLPKDKMLSEGSQGSKVRGAQELMNRLGSDLKTDGKFGPKTQEAVKKLQKENGLKDDGIIGQETLKLLNGKSKPSEQKPADQKPVDQKPVDHKPADQKPAKPADQKPADQKPAKPADQKPADQKPAKPADQQPPAKPADQQPPAKPADQQPPAKPADQKPPEQKKEFAYLKDNVRQALEKSGKFELLRKLPPEVASMYDKMTPKDRDAAGKQLAGSTWGVSHRDAFVTGQAMGMDTFSIMTDKVKEKMAAGTMSRQEGEATLKAMPLLRNLSQKQRDAIADMLIMQAR